MKRKLSGGTVSTASPPSPLRTPNPSPPPKRRKFSALESGFAQLTLNNPIATSTTHIPSHASTLGPFISEFVLAPRDLLAMDADVEVPAHDVILPSVIEEPSIPEVKMRSSSWYEPEPDRIVVTDLDSSSDDDEGTELDIPSISISRPLLKRLASHAKELLDPHILGPDASQALVLYQPLRHDSMPHDSKGKDSTVVDDVTEDNAMDVEHW